MNYSIIQKISIILVMIVSITSLVIKLFSNRVKANLIHLEMMSLMDENDELTKYEENNNPESDDDVDTYEKQEGFSTIIEGLDIGKEMRKTFEKPFTKMKDSVQSSINTVKGPIDEITNFVNDVKRAFECGAFAVVIGNAITGIDSLVEQFAKATPLGSGRIKKNCSEQI